MSSGRDPKTGRFLKGHKIRNPTKRKKEKQLAEARRRGELDAELKFHKNKPLIESAREHIGKLIDRIQIDPLEIVAVAGMTIAIHQFIESTPSVMKYALSGTNFPFIDIGLIIVNQLGLNSPQAEADALKKAISNNEWLVWLMSVALAYILVHNAGALIGLLNGGIEKIVPFLLGVPV